MLPLQLEVTIVMLDNVKYQLCAQMLWTLNTGKIIIVKYRYGLMYDIILVEYLDTLIIY